LVAVIVIGLSMFYYDYLPEGQKFLAQNDEKSNTAKDDEKDAEDNS